MSEARVLRCRWTGNPCGTDTWRVGDPCDCENCATWLAIFEAGRNAGLQEARGLARSAPGREPPVAVGGVWVRSEPPSSGDPWLVMVVAVEIEGHWIDIFTQRIDLHAPGALSHIIEAAGIRARERAQWPILPAGK